MTLSISNRCRATLEKLLCTVPSRKTAPVYMFLPEIELALASGWTRKELWESLSGDGLEVSYKTFNTIIRRSRKKPRATAPRNWGKERGSAECEQLQRGDVLNGDGHDPLANLKRLEQNRPGFHWRGTNSQRTVMNRREEANDKKHGNGNGRTSIHIALQGKGGVGKSLISAILSQYLSSKGQDVCGIDVDPVNQTFSEYQGLRVECLNLLREGSIDQREFDLLMERFLKEVGTFVVDTGASTFIPLWHYILENHGLDHLRPKAIR